MKHAGFIAKARSFLASPGTFRLIVALFLVQAVLSLVFISPSTPKDGIGGRYVERNEDGVIPDGHRHIGAIYYYTERPILAGPVIANTGDDELWMGDLVRFPSYLYYYVLSFPIRIAVSAGASDTTIIYLIRAAGILLGLLALLTFRKISQLVTSSVTVQNISALALTLTGSFVWLSAAENYDMPALLLWFAFLYASMSLFIKKDGSYLYWMALWFFMLSVTKYTYIPFMGILGLVALWLYAKNSSALNVKRLAHSITKDFKAKLHRLRVWQISLAVIVLLASTSLFTERIIGNLVTYHSFNPSCEKIHSHEACMKFGVYARNYNQKQRLANGTVQPIEYVPVVGYPAYWVKRYFDSMYVYMGHIYIPQYSLLVEVAGIFAAIVGAILFVIARIKRIRLFNSQPERYLLGVVIVLTGAQFIFNLNTVLNYGGQTYAHQGRYLLPVVGFAYLLYFIALSRVYKKQPAKTKRVTIAIGLCIAAYTIVIASAIPSFVIHATSPNWYSQFGQDILPSWVINRK